jgi:hypothetical protein
MQMPVRRTDDRSYEPKGRGFAEELGLAALGFEGATSVRIGRPSYHPAALLKIHILNRVASSRRLARECQRSIEFIWLTVARSRLLGHRGLRRCCG